MPEFLVGRLPRHSPGSKYAMLVREFDRAASDQWSLGAITILEIQRSLAWICYGHDRASIRVIS